MRRTSLPSSGSLGNSFRVTPVWTPQEDSTEFPALKKQLGHRMYATIRRYESIDQSRAAELTTKVDQSLVPRLSKLSGFAGYHLVEAGDGVMSSISFFETSAQADESTRVVTDWVRDEKLETALPNKPTITGGEVVVQKVRELVKA